VVRPAPKLASFSNLRMTPLPISSAEIDAVLAPFERALSLPACAYYDDAVFAHERDAIFDRAWLAAGREEDLANPGDWLQVPVAPEGILVVRGADLALRAFYNVCRHRATPLLDGPRGRTLEIRCPYHGWTYELTGALSDARHAPRDFDRNAHALTAVRVDTWQGFVFVSEGDGPGLERHLEGAPPWLLEAPLREARRAHVADYEVLANWKLLVENFQESHHFSSVHPALERLTPSDRACSRLTEGNWLAGTMELAPDAETVSVSAARSRRPFLAPGTYRNQVSDAMLFPTMLTSLQPDYFLTYRLYPLTPERTRIIAETFVHPAALGASFDGADLTAFWTKVNMEDRLICERQQVGIRSRGFRPSRYATVEEGVHAFDKRVAQAYAT
jgi:Rieske 2Fe-2S family protein